MKLTEAEHLVHFCVKCGHAFDESGVLSDGGYDCDAELLVVPVSRWRALVGEAPAMITEAGRAALKQKDGGNG